MIAGSMPAGVNARESLRPARIVAPEIDGWVSVAGSVWPEARSRLSGAR